MTSRRYWQLLDLLLAPPSSQSTSSSNVVLPPALSTLLTQLFRQLSNQSQSASKPSEAAYADLLSTLAQPARKLLGLVPNVAEALIDLLGEALTSWSQLGLQTSEAQEAWGGVVSVLIEELEEVLPNNLTRRKVRSLLLCFFYTPPYHSKPAECSALCHLVEMMNNQKLLQTPKTTPN